VEPYYLREIFDARPFRLDEGATADELVFPDLGYAAAALDSYETFARLREEGAIPAGVRFQVSLPTPAAVTGAFIVPEDRAAFEPAYERALLAELDRIVAGIPHEHLAIQWDTAVEFALLEGRIEPWFDDVLGGVVERALRQAAAVPPGVEVGYHLCYGDVEEHHFVQPADAGHLAAVARGILEGAGRPVAWVHLPVPIERDDDAYFAPLADVRLPEGTELYLGLLHHEDGVEGAQRRARAAATVQPRFGVATECGFGRGPSERTGALLDLHAAVAGAW
jgi:methionine synthase II (cobalamin-independent)